jgi:hypothetical protein
LTKVVRFTLSVEEVLDAFNGVRVASLHEYLLDAPSDIDVGRIAKATREPSRSVGATWMVKHLLETGRGDQLQMDRVFAAFGFALPWQAHLHLSQSVQYAPNSAIEYADAIGQLCKAERPFLRAWAIDAFTQIATLDLGVRARAKAILQLSLADPAASVRARARKLEKTYKWTNNDYT